MKQKVKMKMKMKYRVIFQCFTHKIIFQNIYFYRGASINGRMELVSDGRQKSKYDIKKEEEYKKHRGVLLKVYLSLFKRF